MNRHFISRLIERCPGVQHPFAVARRARDAVRDGDETFAVRIMDGRHNRGIHRLFLPQGRFYVVADDATGAPITFLRQQEIAAIKATMRGRSRSTAAFSANKFCCELRREGSHIRKRKDQRGFWK